jgi:hypothetical protein
MITDISKLILLFFISTSVLALPCGTQDNQASLKATVMTDENGNFKIWKPTEQKNLTYCISDRFRELKPKITKAMQIATQDWMAHGNVKFVYVPEADITCDNRKGPSTLFRIEINRSRRYRYAGRAFFPYDERNTITFKKSYVEKNFEELLRLTRHELGHVLGLRHEHIRDENPNGERCKEVDTFAGITDYDPDSIMHYARCGGTGTTDLSDGDREGIAILYPL